MKTLRHSRSPKHTPAPARVALILLALFLAAFTAVSEEPADYQPAPGDILIADFEGDTYGEWKAAGEAFGERPAIANVRPGNRVTGHVGKGLVNSYLGGDEPTGTLTSPPFTIERKHINLLVGAGNFEEKTCVDLLVDGKVVRSATGPAEKDAEGREILDWRSWEVGELAGKTGVIRIVDDCSGGWGHINVDQIHQSNRALKSTLPPKPSRPLPGAPSLVPQYTFAGTLEEQEKQLASNPLLQRFHAARAAMADDPHRPIYHYVNPEGGLNDPNGLCFWQGRWHLFYQAYPPEDKRQHWGHAVSDDLIHWRDLPLAIYPSPEDKCYSGATMVEDGRVIAAYHGVGAGTMVAVSSDPLLLNWEKVSGKAVIPHAKPGEPPLPYNIFDPCIWKRGDYYYILTAGTLPDGPGGKPVRAEFLHRSKDLATWEYLHPFLENDLYLRVGDDGACPYFWPIGDRHILIHYSHTTGGKYLLGEYDTGRDKFVVTNGGDFNFGPSGPGGVHAPSACPDGDGIIVLFNMNPAAPTSGWNQIMTLPRRLTLIGPDEIGVEPAGDIESVRGAHTHIDAMTLPANEEIVLEGVRGNAMELVAEFDPQGASMLELNVLRSPGAEEFTRITFLPSRGYRDRANPKKPLPGVLTLDNSRSSIAPDVKCRPPEVAEVSLEKDEPLKLRIFIDKSVVEVFANGKQCVALRVYPSREDSLGVSLRAQGGEAKLTSLDAWQMKSVYR